MTEGLVAVIFFLAAFVQGLSGFGSGLVSMALLPLFMGVQQAVAVSSVIGVMITVSFAIRLRAHTDRAEVAPMALAGLLGVPVGLWLLHSLDAGLVTGLLGAVLCTHASWSLLRGDRQGRTLARGWAVLAGALGGALSGAFNTSGPPVLVYATLRHWPRDVFRANLQTFFTVTGTLSLIGFATTGLITWQTLRLDAIALPAVVLGAWGGNRLSARVDPIAFRRGVLVALLAMGAYYIVRLF